MKALFTALFAFALSLSSLAFGASWKIVPNKEVCMVTDMYFARDQIPVTHSGKTYYGCCEGCKETLSKDAQARTAQDPVSKKPVDKATAVIASDESNKVLYFESKKSFEAYLKTQPAAR